MRVSLLIREKGAASRGGTPPLFTGKGSGEGIQRKREKEWA
jgi:hypothetical protein